ncbi:cytochrome P450 2L1 isoform X2 [Cherax quadricarinatus]|uniref:cytochrome P450 2L1 isoform X2 n=1 Tax=Cherax quadricarinatus TaxID=27406 RepID=UPI00387E393A
MIVEVLLLVLLALLVVYYFHQYPVKNLPPGPLSFPIIGNLRRVIVAEDVRKFRNKYGDIFRVRAGSVDMTFICNFKLVKEVFSKTECSDRPHWDDLHFLTDGRQSGVILTNGEQWQNARRFLLRNLRDLGMGKSFLEATIQEEAQMLVNDFRRYDGKAGHLPRSINIAVLNVIWQLVASRRYELDDKEINSFIALLKFLQEDAVSVVLPVFYPILNYLPRFLTRKLLKLDLVGEIKQSILRFMGDIIESHKAKLDPNNPRDVIDEYLLEMNNKSEIASFFSEVDLTRSIFDLFFAGFDTTSNTLRWMCLYMAAYPDVQKNVQKEIDDAVPRDRLPSQQEKSQLQYLEAVIHEVLRMSSLIPFSLFHYVTQDIQVGGYVLPKVDVSVWVSLWPGWSCLSSQQRCSRTSPSLHQP